MKKSLFIIIVVVQLALVSCDKPYNSDTEENQQDASQPFQIENLGETLENPDVLDLELELEGLGNALEKFDVLDLDLEKLGIRPIRQEVVWGTEEISIRLIPYLSPLTGGVGTLERAWTYAEIKRNDTKIIQAIYEKAPNVSQHFKLFLDNNEVYAVIAGYTTAYRPHPLFVSFWKLSETGFIPAEIINEAVDKTDTIFRCLKNELIVENYSNQLNFEWNDENGCGELLIMDVASNLFATITCEREKLLIK